MKQTISQSVKNYLAAGTKTRGAKSFGDWLREEKKRREDERVRGELHAEAARRAAGYGMGGEALAKDGLIGDGYAAFLQKQAEGRLQDALFALDEKGQKASTEEAAGYAAYLSALREGQLGAVEKAVNEALNTPAHNKPSISPALSALGLTEKQIETVLTEYKGGVSATEDPSFIYSIARHLTKFGYSYERAYVFCRTAGLSEEKSLELATLMSAEAEKKSAYMEELLEKSKVEPERPLLSVINPNLY